MLGWPRILYLSLLKAGTLGVLTTLALFLYVFIFVLFRWVLPIFPDCPCPPGLERPSHLASSVAKTKGLHRPSDSIGDPVASIPSYGFVPAQH